MTDKTAVGLFEILIVAIVALLAVGPERMPEAVRTVALTIGRIKRAFQSAKSDIEEHIGADEIRRQLHNEEIMASEKIRLTEQEDKSSQPVSTPTSPIIPDRSPSHTANSSS